MLNEDKIKLMTSIAMFEKKEGKAIFPANRYFKSDYISSRMLRSFFTYTISYALFLVIWMLCNMEKVLSIMNLNQVVATVKLGVILYFAGLAVYFLITYFVYRKRYEYMARGMKVYLAKLKRLEKRYEFQNRSKELTREGGRGQ